MHFILFTLDTDLYVCTSVYLLAIEQACELIRVNHTKLLHHFIEKVFVEYGKK